MIARTSIGGFLIAVLAVPILSAMGFGDSPDAPNPPADDATEQADGEGPVALVTEDDVPLRGIASLSNGRDLRNAAEDEAAAQTAAAQSAADAAAAAEAEAAEATAESRVAAQAETTTTAAAPVTAPPTTAAPTTTAPPPPPPPPPTNPPAAAPPVTSAIWDQIAACESGGNWSINTGNGYYGGLQFLLSTWQMSGGTQYAAYPHQASREAQIAVAERVVAASGGSYGAWGGCAASLGLP